MSPTFFLNHTKERQVPRARVAKVNKYQLQVMAINVMAAPLFHIFSVKIFNHKNVGKKWKMKDPLPNLKKKRTKRKFSNTK